MAILKLYCYFHPIVLSGDVKAHMVVDIYYKVVRSYGKMQRKKEKKDQILQKCTYYKTSKPEELQKPKLTHLKSI